MNAQDLTKALGGRWTGASGIARCPSHDDQEPSLSVRDGGGGKLLTYCHAGCSAEAVWAALAHAGLVGSENGNRRGRYPVHVPPMAPGPSSGGSPEHVNHQRSALKIWRSTRPCAGSPVEQYLLSRGITTPIPPTIRYHPALLHPDIGQHLPAMVAAVCNVEREVTGIQRTYLTMDGRKVPLNRPRLALGTLRGSAVRLAPTIDRVWLAEGIEDGLALMQMMGEPAWAVLGTSGFKSVELPDRIKQVILAPDGDDAGRAVVQDAARCLAGQGREVRAAKLPAGKDWCDVLDTYEERAGILEFDLEIYRPDAETLARREVIHG